MILSAQQADPAERHACLEYLVNLYREPVRRFIHTCLVGCGVPCPEDDADDLTQNFFIDFMTRNRMDGLNRERGAFRAFLRVALRNYVTSAFRQRESRSPTGVLTRLAFRTSRSIDDGFDDPTVSSPHIPDSGSPTPDEIYDRACAQRLVADAVEVFRQQCADRKLQHYFAVFERHAWRPEDFDRPAYRDSADALGCTEKDVTNHLHRAKKAFKKVLWEVVRQTVATDEDVAEELAALRRWFE